MTVKRYTPTQCCEHDGTYITYSDYQKLVSENVALKEFIVEECVIPHEFYGDNKDAADFMPETPATDAAIAEIKAQGVDEFLNDEFVQEVAMRLADFNGETEESVSTVVWSGMPPEPEGNVWELEYVSRASFLSRKLKEFAANLRAGSKG